MTLSFPCSDSSLLTQSPRHLHPFVVFAFTSTVPFESTHDSVEACGSAQYPGPGPYRDAVQTVMFANAELHLQEESATRSMQHGFTSNVRDIPCGHFHRYTLSWYSDHVFPSQVSNSKPWCNGPGP